MLPYRVPELVHLVRPALLQAKTAASVFLALLGALQDLDLLSANLAMWALYQMPIQEEPARNAADRRMPLTTTKFAGAAHFHL